jgi:hypothetical protein
LLSCSGCFRHPARCLGTRPSRPKHPGRLTKEEHHLLDIEDMFSYDE